MAAPWNKMWVCWVRGPKGQARGWVLGAASSSQQLVDLGECCKFPQQVQGRAPKGSKSCVCLAISIPYFTCGYVSAYLVVLPMSSRSLAVFHNMPMQTAKLDITHLRVLSLCVAAQDTARDLGIIIDSQLSLSAHVTAVCPSGYYQLHQLRQAIWSLSEDASKTLVQAFATRCSSASPKDWWTGCSQFSTPLPVRWPVLDAPPIYRQCSVSYTGYRWT